MEYRVTSVAIFFLIYRGHGVEYRYLGIHVPVSRCLTDPGAVLDPFRRDPGDIAFNRSRRNLPPDGKLQRNSYTVLLTDCFLCFLIVFVDINVQRKRFKTILLKIKFPPNGDRMCLYRVLFKKY